MASCEYPIYEYPVKIIKRFSLKMKKLRVFSINGKPIIQLVSSKTNRGLDIPICTAARSFIGFSSMSLGKSLKIILLKKSLEFYFTDEKEFIRCKNNINSILAKYHLKRESMFNSNFVVLRDNNDAIKYIETDSNKTNQVVRISDESEYVTYNREEENETEYIESSCVYPISLISVGSTGTNFGNGNGYGQSFQTDFNNGMDVKLRNHQTIVYESLNDDNCVKLRNHDHKKYHLENNLEKDYIVPEFQFGKKPIDVSLEHFESSEFPTNGRSWNRNPIFFLSMKIREEIANVGGVKITFSGNDLDKFDIKEFNKELLISKIKDHDKIGKVLHFGDRIVAVNDKIVYDKATYQELIRSNSTISLIIQRLPKARVVFYVKNEENMILYQNRKFMMSITLSGEKELWYVSEINETDTLHIDDKMVSNIQNLINSRCCLSLILHSERFVKDFIGF